MKCLVTVAFYFIFALIAEASNHFGVAPGKFLIATAYLQDPRFKESVILMVEYNRNGALGIVVNFPTNARFSKTFPDWRRVGFDDIVFLGGPVDLQQLFMIIQTKRPPEKFRKIFDDVYISNSREGIEAYLERRSQKDRIRLFAGYAGWAPGQLDAEIATGHWQVIDADVESLFDETPSRLWRMLREKLSTIRRVSF